MASGALHRCFQAKKDVNASGETMIHRSRFIPSTGTSLGRCWRGRSAASHSCSARNLPVVVLIDWHGAPLIDDISFGCEGKLK
jgi:hypothetical protein